MRPTEADRLEESARDAYASGDLEGCLSAWEELQRRQAGAGDRLGSARAACMVALHLLIDTGLMAPVRAWVRRAEALMADLPEAPPHAMVAMISTYERFMCGDPAASRAHAVRAVELGRRLDVPAAVVMGSIAAARLDLLEGRVADGLAALDDVAALLATDYADPLTTGMAYCELICAAQGMLLHERAREWTEVMQGWRPGREVGAIGGRCLVHQAEQLRISGPADAAERTAEEALARLRPWLRREFGWPLVELGAIRLRRGDLDGAEEALLAAHAQGWCPQPALALLRLEQGDADAAAALIAEAIARPLDIPWKERPPIGDLRLFPFYAAQCEIAAARGDRETAAQAASELDRIAGTHPSAGSAATAALAAARVALLDGDHGAAAKLAGRAVGFWSETSAPFEVAAARLTLAEAHRAGGNAPAAELEARAAAAAFAAFGSPRWAARAAQRLPSAPRSALEGSMVEVGDLLEVSFAGRTTTVRDLTGFRTLRRLLAEPGREFHVLDLVAVPEGRAPERRAESATAQEGFHVECGLPVLDDQAREAYRRRLAEIEEDIAEAEADGDRQRVELAESDRAFLVRELSAAVGLSGRSRTTGDPAERARSSVARSLRYALGVLAEQHAELAEHLRLHVRTGLYCRYVPDPTAPVTWRV